MDRIDKKIVEWIGRKGETTGKQLTGLLKMSRQALNKRLSRLIVSGLVVRSGSRKNAVYLPSSSKKTVSELLVSRKVSGLEEDAVFNEFVLKLGLNRLLGKNAMDILRFAFTEMLNNAIDHSRSEKCSIHVALTPYLVSYTVRDYGIGIFASIKNKFVLKDESEALQDLLKGKTTTMKERHSGEGVFFTSRACDEFRIRSHRIMYAFERSKNQPIVGQIRNLSGTEITCRIRIHTKKKLEQVFREFAPEEYDYRFDKTAVFVRLIQKDLVSRSEAKRLLAGLERFREIHLDLTGVNSMSQGFADEVFRVFHNDHPVILIVPENANPAILAMISHVVDN